MSARSQPAPRRAPGAEPDRVQCPLFDGSVDLSVCLTCRRLLRLTAGTGTQIACALLNDALWRGEREQRTG